MRHSRATVVLGLADKLAVIFWERLPDPQDTLTPRVVRPDNEILLRLDWALVEVPRDFRRRTTGKCYLEHSDIAITNHLIR
jgi:hypothetical protein